MEGHEVLVIGDFNARLGNLAVFEEGAEGIRYSDNSDLQRNSNGTKLINLCSNMKLFPVNHSQVHSKRFSGKLTFKRSHNWISQLDWALASADTLTSIMEFHILDNIPISSDHAALLVVITTASNSLQNVKETATYLGLSTVTEKINLPQNSEVSKYIQIDICGKAS